jgi:hypothetical protein
MRSPEICARVSKSECEALFDEYSPCHEPFLVRRATETIARVKIRFACNSLVNTYSHGKQAVNMIVDPLLPALFARHDVQEVVYNSAT